MRSINQTNTLALIGRAFLLTAANFFVLAGFATAEPGQTKVDVVLSNLPPSSSPAYSKLYDAAERPHREMLEMTKAEVWTVAAEKLDTVVAAAAIAGAKLTKLDATWNRALAPMAKPDSMSAEQKTMMHEAMDS
jgi:hypothetical protein